ncbi:MAG: triose-phosphate isomerase, partial [Candidatus Eremiobacteraeota bacterium]|nr:triose-phosphate isomerase [Candidatus Eremiobacteraeota bacterium]
MPFDKLWIGTSWKMSKLRADARSFGRALAESELAYGDAAQLFVVPPFTAVAELADILAGTRVAVGVQNLHWADSGPWTGEISGAMAADCGATL